MNALYKFFRSVKLAVVLILVIAVLSILATLVPQAQDPAFYFHTYPPLVARALVALGFDNFFRSLLFLVPAGLFFVNLSVCTVDRLARRSRARARRRYGPDLIHIGLLLLIVGAMFSAFARREAMVYRGEGEDILLPGDYAVRVLSFEFEQYEDGRPKDWVSTVQVSRGGETVIPSYAIEVNRPLKIARVKLYQASYADQGRATLVDPEGVEHVISSGEGFEWQGRLLLFQGLEGAAFPEMERAIFEQWEGHRRTDVIAVARDEMIGQYRVADLSSRMVTGLKAVRDPGFLPVLIALVVLAAGLSLTFIQKRRDLEGEQDK